MMSQTHLPGQQQANLLVEGHDVIILWGEDAPPDEHPWVPAVGVVLQVAEDVTHQVRLSLTGHDHIVGDLHQHAVREAAPALADGEQVIGPGLLCRCLVWAHSPLQQLHAHVDSQTPDLHVLPKVMALDGGINDAGAGTPRDDR